MNEKQLSHYALAACILGFLILGYVVLFVPISLDDSGVDFIDGEIIQSYSTSSGDQVIKIKQVEERSILIKENQNFTEGERYRFYDPQGEDLLFISDFRKLS